MVQIRKTPTAVYSFTCPTRHLSAPDAGILCGAVIELKALLKFLVI